MTKHDDDLLAAEYALGLLNDADTITFEERLQSEPTLKAACLKWYEDFASLHEHTQDIVPPATLKAKIQF